MSTASAVPPAPGPIEPRSWWTRARRHRATPVKYVGLILLAVIILTPVYVLIVTSVKGVAETDPSHAWSLPSLWTLDAWRDAWDQLSPNLANSFKLAIPATLISIVLGSLNGFVLSKWRFPGADIVFTFFLFGMFIPYQAVMIPLTQLFEDVHFPAGIPRLVFAHIVYGIPITALIFRSYYATIPEELMEAARMDRAGMLRTYWSVILPLSAPVLAVVGLLGYIATINEFIIASVLLDSTNKYPMSVGLYGFIQDKYAQQWGTFCAGVVLAAIPVVVLFFFLQRFIAEGLTRGAVKG